MHRESRLARKGASLQAIGGNPDAGGDAALAIRPPQARELAGFDRRREGPGKTGARLLRGPQQSAIEFAP
jgi:hypothetical protein